jgi:hypothetical protein
MLGGDGRLDPATHFDPRLMALFRQDHERFAELWTRLTEAATGSEAANCVG